MSTPTRRISAAERQRHLDRLGNAIQARRSALRLSQEEVGHRGRMHRNYIGALERGEVNPTYMTLLRISQSLDMPVVDLIGRAQVRPRRRASDAKGQ